MDRESLEKAVEEDDADELRLCLPALRTVVGVGDTSAFSLLRQGYPLRGASASQMPRRVGV